MKVSVCLTVFNEEKSIENLINSLLKQSKKPDEIVIVDGGSTDRTLQLLKQMQKKVKTIRVLIQKCTRAGGRNLSVEIARNEIIAITDADCKADGEWLKKITEPFTHKEVDMVAGFYKMLTKTPLEKALSYFLAVTPKRFGPDFLPSTRSIAFRKCLWERVGGFPEDSENSAEDTDFNYEVVRNGAGIARVKDAIVYWSIPVDIKGAFRKFSDYAKWDARKLILWHPTQRFKSHNIKALLKIFRYLIFLLTLLLGIGTPLFIFVFVLEIIIYSYLAFRKVYLEFGDYITALWGIPIQYLSDIAVIKGFGSGILEKLSLIR